MGVSYPIKFYDHKCCGKTLISEVKTQIFQFSILDVTTSNKINSIFQYSWCEMTECNQDDQGYGAIVKP